MAEIKPGKLRECLDPILGNMWAFGMYSAPVSANENEIQSVTIHRGKSSRGGGSHPSTLEITLTGRYSATTSGHNVRFFIREPAAELLAAHLGGSASVIGPRYVGRLAKSSVEDRGLSFSTTLSAASWISQMNYSPKSFTPKAGMTAHTVISGLSSASDPLRGINMAFFGGSEVVARDQEPTLFKDGISQYAEDIGILMQETRSGTTNVFGHLWRGTNAEAKMLTEYPLTRSQAISPAQWEQSNERPPAIVNYKVTNSTGGVAVRTVNLGSGTGEQQESVDFDWSHIKLTTDDNQLYREAYARAFELSDQLYRIPSITVDLLYLISSPYEYHRKQAAQLLSLEAGDPVFLSGDWPTPVDGIHFAEGITEQITADSWTVELSLVPSSHAIGKQTTSVPARVWDSARNTWDSETRTWDKS